MPDIALEAIEDALADIVDLAAAPQGQDPLPPSPHAGPFRSRPAFIFLGREIHRRGGIELMREVAARVSERDSARRTERMVFFLNWWVGISTWPMDEPP